MLIAKPTPALRATPPREGIFKGVFCPPTRRRSICSASPPRSNASHRCRAKASARSILRTLEAILLQPERSAWNIVRCSLSPLERRIDASTRKDVFMSSIGKRKLSPSSIALPLLLAIWPTAMRSQSTFDENSVPPWTRGTSGGF